MATRRKPHDPATAQRAALERKARDAEAQRLEAQGATVKRDRAGHIISAYRSNVFNLLLTRGTITQSHHDAAVDIAKLWTIWKGLDGGPEPTLEVVCGSGEMEAAERGLLAAQRQSWAGKRLGWVFARLQPRSAKLLCAFMVATVEEDRAMQWRGIVERELGETVRDKQTKLVVDALEALRAVLHEPGEKAA